MKIYDWAECHVAPRTEKAFSAMRKAKDRRRLKNEQFSIIAPNCIGGGDLSQTGAEISLTDG